MKIYCACCKKWVLDSTEKFVSGGPYRGDMFQPKAGLGAHADFFQFSKGTQKGDLACPLCRQGMLRQNGELVTEHGVIRSGQKTYDPSVSIIYSDRERFSWLKKIEYSLELPEGAVQEPEKPPEGEPLWDQVAIVSTPVWRPPEESVLEEKEPEEEEKPPGSMSPEDAETFDWTCTVCGRVCKSYAGLMAHMRVHPEKDDDK